MFIKKFHKSWLLWSALLGFTQYGLAQNAIPSGLTAQTVIANYIKAIGGVEKVKAVKDITINTNFTISGVPVPLKSSVKIKIPDRYLQQVVFAATDGTQDSAVVVSKILVKGTSVTSTAKGADLKLDDAKKAAMIPTAKHIFSQLDYGNPGYKLALSSTTKLMNGSSTYEVAVTNLTGEVVKQYYDTSTGFEVESETTHTPDSSGYKAVEQDFYSDYKAVDGIQIPYSRKVQIALQLKDGGDKVMNYTVQNIKINSGLADQDFQ